MTTNVNKKIWTIGHSTRSLNAFIKLLKSAGVMQIVDVRGHPGSNKFPQFNKEALAVSMPKENIGYTHIKELGGRRKGHPNSKNTVWRNKSFRAYADYMETNQFKEGLTYLQNLAQQSPTAFMCAEAVWWRCHRSMIADALKAQGWQVMHIMGEDKATEHPFTKPAKVSEGKLVYGAE